MLDQADTHSCLKFTNHGVEFCLPAHDRADLQFVLRDPIQNNRVKKRASLLLLADGSGRPDLVARNAGVALSMVQSLLQRYHSNGIRGALLGIERRPEKCQYDVEGIVRALRQLVVSRPPSGIYWSVKTLAEAVIERVPGTEGITGERVRSILSKKLGIRSVRHLEPYWLIQSRMKSSLISQ